MTRRNLFSRLACLPLAGWLVGSAPRVRPAKPQSRFMDLEEFAAKLQQKVFSDDARAAKETAKRTEAIRRLTDELQA
jgi:hypothetical protein